MDVFAPAAAGPPLELVLDHIIERKRMDDLSRSIIDRRFAEQKVIGVWSVTYAMLCVVVPSR